MFFQKALINISENTCIKSVRRICYSSYKRGGGIWNIFLGALLILECTFKSFREIITCVIEHDDFEQIMIRLMGID